MASFHHATTSSTGWPKLLHGAAGVALGGRIQIDDAALRIEHEHAVVHAVHHHVARDGHEAEQAVAIDAPREARAGDGERQRRGIEAGTGSTRVR